MLRAWAIASQCAWNQRFFRKREFLSRRIAASRHGSTITLAMRCMSSSCWGLHLFNSESMRFRRSRGSSSLSSNRRVLGDTSKPFAMATIVSRLGTFCDRSTSPQKFPVIFPLSAAFSRLSFAAFRSLRTRCANKSLCFTPLHPRRP